MNNHANISHFVNDKPVGEPGTPIPDPFAHTTISIGKRDLLKHLLRRRGPLNVKVVVGADDIGHRAWFEGIRFDPTTEWPTILADVDFGLSAQLEHLMDEFGPSGVERVVRALRCAMTVDKPTAESL